MRLPLLALVLLAPALAAAQVKCGDTIGRGQTVTLTQDLGPCDALDPQYKHLRFALIVNGGTLDLGGHTVTCADGPDRDIFPASGIWVRGKRAKLVNGTVVGCYPGVEVGGDPEGEVVKSARHYVENVAVRDAGPEGFLITGSKSTLIDVSASNASFGFDVDGWRHKLYNAVATGNTTGFAVRGRRLRLHGCTATGNLSHGFRIGGNARRSSLIACESNGNEGTGFHFDDGANTAKDCTADSNVQNGFTLLGRLNRIRGGSAHGNGGFDLANCVGARVSNLAYATEAGALCPEP